MRLNKMEKHLFVRQMQLLDLGMAAGPGLLSEEFGAKASGITSPLINSLCRHLHEAIELRFAELADSLKHVSRSEVRQVVAQRNDLIRDTFAACSSVASKCSVCKMPRRRIRTHEQNKIFFSSNFSKTEPLEIADNLKEILLTQTEIQEHLRQLWMNDEQFLSHLVGALKLSGKEVENAFEVFFVEVSP
jgi:hypothetical protein